MLKFRHKSGFVWFLQFKYSSPFVNACAILNAKNYKKSRHLNSKVIPSIEVTVKLFFLAFSLSNTKYIWHKSSVTQPQSTQSDRVLQWAGDLCSGSHGRTAWRDIHSNLYYYLVLIIFILLFLYPLLIEYCSNYFLIVMTPFSKLRSDKI